MAPRGKISRSTQAAPAKRRTYRKGIVITNARAGRMCASVRATCDAKTASSAASSLGADCGGCANATNRRMTTAIEIRMQIQKTDRSHFGNVEGASGLSNAVSCETVLLTGRLAHLSLVSLPTRTRLLEFPSRLAI